MRPFQNIIGDPEQEYVADGMVDDIITALSRFAAAYANVSDAPLRSQEVIRRCIRAFPGIRRADRKTRAELGAADDVAARGELLGQRRALLPERTLFLLLPGTQPPLGPPLSTFRSGLLG